MYLQHFHLERHPFRITPDISLFFPGGGRGAVLDALIYAITTGEGVVKVVGEVGSGKTMLCRILEKRLPGNIEIVYLANPGVEAAEVLRAIAFELKLDIDNAARQFNLLQQITAYLLQQYAAGRRVVVFIEEAQNTPLATLEEIRMLANLETGSDKLLQIVLFGQPELDAKLGEHSIRQLKERITHSFSLIPLAQVEIHEYLHFRLAHAGCPNPHLFSKEAVRIIARASCGLLRRVNILADKALLAAYIDHASEVRLSHAQAALQDSEFGAPPSVCRLAFWGRKPLLAGAAVLLLAIGYLAGLLHERPGTSESSGRPPRVTTEAPRRQSPSSAPTVRQAAPTAPLPQSMARRPAAGHILLPQDMAALVEQRLQRTSAWMSTVSPEIYVLQLMVVSPPTSTKLTRLLEALRDNARLEQTWIYHTAYRGEPGIVVLFGEYDSFTKATTALASLPEPVRAAQPFVRSLRAVQEATP